MKLSAEMVKFLQQTKERAKKEVDIEVGTLNILLGDGCTLVDELIDEGLVEEVEELFEELEEINARLDQLLGPLPDESLN